MSVVRLSAFSLPAALRHCITVIYILTNMKAAVLRLSMRVCSGSVCGGSGSAHSRKSRIIFHIKSSSFVHTRRLCSRRAHTHLLNTMHALALHTSTQRTFVGRLRVCVVALANNARDYSIIYPGADSGRIYIAQHFVVLAFGGNGGTRRERAARK